MYTSVIVHEVSVPRLMWMLKAGLQPPFIHFFACLRVWPRGWWWICSSPLLPLTWPSSLKVGFPEFSWLLLRCSPRLWKLHCAQGSSSWGWKAWRWSGCGPGLVRQEPVLDFGSSPSRGTALYGKSFWCSHQGWERSSKLFV